MASLAVKISVSFVRNNVGAWRGVGDAAGEHALKEKEKEKDTRIQVCVTLI